MDRIMICLGLRILERFRVPVFMVVVFLQRSPIINSLVEKQFSVTPRIAHLIKWVCGSGVAVGSLNTVTGATASVKLLAGYDDTTGTKGEYFRLSFASADYTVGSYKLGTTPPPGLSLSPTVNEFGVGTVDGIPTQSGVYNLDIWAYEEDNRTGDSTLLALTIYINEKGPNIIDQPQSVSLNWGAVLNLDVSIQNPNGATFQWQKDGADIPGATTSAFHIPQATSQDAGLYQVLITQDGDTATSEAASVTVEASGIQVWKEQAFDNPFSEISDPQKDPDLDGLINLVEYAIGTDPEISTVLQVPVMGREGRIDGEYVAYSYPKNPNATDLTIHADYTDNLGNLNWVQIYNFLNGIRVEESDTELKILVPIETVCFVRFRITGSSIQ